MNLAFLNGGEEQEQVEVLCFRLYRVVRDRVSVGVLYRASDAELLAQALRNDAGEAGESLASRQRRSESVSVRVEYRCLLRAEVEAVEAAAGFRLEVLEQD